MSLEALAEKYATNINFEDVLKSQGLTAERAAYLLQENGPNSLTPPPRVPLWLLFLLQFTNLFMILMLAAGTLSILTFAIDQANRTNLYLGLLLYIVVFATCYENYTQEAKADELMEKFRAMVPEAATVIRGGVISQVPSADVRGNYNYFSKVVSHSDIPISFPLYSSW